jgi:hypothetical protein
MTRHVVMWSGGITSWATARHVIAQHGTASVTLLFADTLIEDDDLYAFNEQAATQLGVAIIRVADGRTPWQVFEDKQWIGNTRIAQCSLDLKQRQCRIWLDPRHDPADTVLYLGIDYSETHRIRAIRTGYAHTADGCKKVELGGEKVRVCAGLFDDDGNRLPGPGCSNLLPVAWAVDFPLTRPPYSDKQQLIGEAKAAGLSTPKMYDLGFAHANCGGACVKGGQGQWLRLLEVFPDRYAKAETFEIRMRDLLGKNVSILRDRTGGTTKPLTLATLRARAEQERADQPSLLDHDDWGGCGCFTDAA